MQKNIQNLFCCPKCHGELKWTVMKETELRIVDADIKCDSCNREYFVKDEIAIFLDELENNDDLWKIVESNLSQALKKDPESEKRLMKSDTNDLNAADKFLRSMILDERREYDKARDVRKIAFNELYTISYVEECKIKMEQMKQLLSDETGPIIDIASGMAGFAELFSELDSSIIISDISPCILRKNKLRLQHFGQYEKVSLIGFDARAMPFKDKSVPIFTSNMGLTNIPDSEAFLEEVKRCLKGYAYFLTVFFPDNGDANAKLLDELNMEFGFRTRLESVSSRYFETSILYPSDSEIEPTVASEIFDISMDTIPAIPTCITWSVVKLKPN